MSSNALVESGFHPCGNGHGADAATLANQISHCPVSLGASSNAIHNVVDDGAKALDKTDVALPVSGKPFDSGYLQPGQTFTRVFTQTSTYRYVCTLHEGNGMKGVIVVRPGKPQTYVAHAHSSTISPPK